MAGRGIRVPFVAEVTDWLRGTRRVSDDLDSLSSDLRDTARAADRAAGDIERDLEDAADDAGRAFRDFADDVDDALDRVRRDADRTGDDVGDDLADGLSRSKSRVGAVGAEVGDELVENLGEAVRSGNPADLVLETFTSLGPALGALGIGAAVVAGIANSFVQKANEQRERITSAAASLFDGVVGDAELTGRQAADAFRRGFVEVGEVGSRLQDTLGTDTVVDAWGRVGELVQQTGLDADTVTSAILGNRDALALVEAALERNDEAADAVYQRIQNTTGGASELATELERSLDPLDDQKQALGEIRTLGNQSADANERAADAHKVSKEVTKGLKAEMRDARDRTDETADKAERVRSKLSAANTEAQNLDRTLSSPVVKPVTIDWKNTQLPEGIATAGRVPGRLPK